MNITSRKNILPLSDVEEFIEFLKLKGCKIKRPKGEYQHLRWETGQENEPDANLYETVANVGKLSANKSAFRFVVEFLKGKAK